MQDMVQALARFHGAWWDSPHLGADVQAWTDAEGFDRSLQIFAEKFALFTDRFNELSPPERRKLYQRLLDQASHLLARYHSAATGSCIDRYWLAVGSNTLFWLCLDMP